MNRHKDGSLAYEAECENSESEHDCPVCNRFYAFQDIENAMLFLGRIQCDESPALVQELRIILRKVERLNWKGGAK